MSFKLRHHFHGKLMCSAPPVNHVESISFLSAASLCSCGGGDTAQKLSEGGITKFQGNSVSKLRKKQMGGEKVSFEASFIFIRL